MTVSKTYATVNGHDEEKTCADLRDKMLKERASGSVKVHELNTT